MKEEAFTSGGNVVSVESDKVNKYYIELQGCTEKGTDPEPIKTAKDGRHAERSPDVMQTESDS